MSLEKNVVKAPIPYRSADGQSHFDFADTYFSKAQKIYESIRTRIEKKFRKELVDPNEVYEIF